MRTRLEGVSSLNKILSTKLVGEQLMGRLVHIVLYTYGKMNVHSLGGKHYKTLSLEGSRNVKGFLLLFDLYLNLFSFSFSSGA